MQIQKVKPTTPGRRHLIKLQQNNLQKKPLIKNKVKGIKKSTGRNNSGKITIFHKGGGVKKKYRQLNFLRTKNSTGIICSIEHDPNRNTNIASVFDYVNNDFFYMLAPQHSKKGDIVKSGLEIEPNLGNSLPISRIPVGTFIHSVSSGISVKSQLSRSAGTYSIIKEKTDKFAVIELSSKEQKTVPLKCFATIGRVSNELFFLTQLSKAGQNRWLNKRPTVRGVAMNPIDHPHGGGEGKKSGQSKTPWGRPNNRGKTGKRK